MTIPTEQQEQYIAIWAKVVETQMHFNEMSVKSRQLGLTFVAAALGIAVVLITRGDDFSIKIPEQEPWFQIHVSVLLIAAAFLALLAVKILDLSVYHKMLRGAVTFGEDFEEHYMKQIFDLNKGMTQTISHFSRYEDAARTTDTVTGKYEYTGESRVTAEDKIRKFYRYTIVFLCVAATVIFIFTNIQLWFPGGNRGQTDQVESPSVVATPPAVPGNGDTTAK